MSYDLFRKEAHSSKLMASLAAAEGRPMRRILVSLLLLPGVGSAADPITDADFAASLSGIRSAVLSASRDEITAKDVSSPNPGQPSQPARKSIPDIIAEMGRLPGTVSLKIERLAPNPAALYSLSPDTPLAIGSAFKLYILAELSRSGAQWDKVLHLKDEYRSLPSGLMFRWPAGAPVTVYGMAAEMISRSDNTATDHLLGHVGRGAVESILSAAGNQNAARSMPFLSTLEMFKLKSDPALLARYLAADEAGRHHLLDNDVRTLPTNGLLDWATRWEDPIAINAVEWFASAADIGQLMDYLRNRNDQNILDIMAINPGLAIPNPPFVYAGFKGGSEPGVISLNWLLKDSTGAWYALSTIWNNPKAALDQDKFIGLVQGIFDGILPPPASSASITRHIFRPTPRSRAVPL